jgi:superoxide dismutase, Fe-Mn family
MYSLPDLPYNHEALEPFIDVATMHLHHEKHHAAYVKNLNDALAGHDDLASLPVDELLTKLDSAPEDIRIKVKNNGGGHANHSFFWTCMYPIPSAPAKPFLDALVTTFGSLDQFKEKFQTAAVGHFGSGWGWLVADKHQLKILDTSNQDSPVSLGLTPLLTVDVWEHAYYLKYQNKRADYVTAWWNVVNWVKVSELFSRL